MEVLNICHEADISANNMQIQELQEAMMKYKYVPTIDEFIKDSLELNSILSKQQDLFCQKMSHITPYLDTNDQLTEKEIDQRTEFNDLNTKISDYIGWKKSKEGRSANMPKIEETHKDILFTD